MMNFIGILFLIFASPSFEGDQRGWNGILPLHSTVAEVEARLGKSLDSCRCKFETPNEAVVVDYSGGECKGPPYGWNVPARTVLQITIYPKSELNITKLNLNSAEFVRNRNLELGSAYYFTNLKRGIKYSVHGGIVHSISYIPSLSDSNLRCQGFPEYDGGVREYYPYARFSHRAQFIDERLSEFAFQLADTQSVMGYVITYAGAVSKRGDAKEMGQYAKRVMTLNNTVAPSRIILIDGGFRKEPEFELFLVPPGMPPPAPTPTLSSNQVKIVTSSPRRSRHRRQP